ncbi:FixH family protein [Flavobacterium sp. ASW18X]|uniref:FixH family protein n=1 Tax=Flavobacterium sp. ASW18X TaxID=2572595 RepID=UPI0010AE8F1F|nr:FixH family protein [Flavobacterium sp. ASW18X]TKD59153.1 cytochrome C oxidase Cbb3 [Flavobacterium sp. ASW18X]
MKLNWGTGIVIAFIGFISFILYFVVRMSTDNKANHDLVTEGYYKQELAYQKEIDAQEYAAALDAELTIEKIPDGLLIRFPENYNYNTISGTMFLYRPSNRHLDFSLPISLSNSHLLIPDNRLLDGRWDITINWTINGKDFLHKQKLIY